MTVSRTLRQAAVLIASTVVAFVVLVQTDVLSRFAYMVEKGRLQAMRESMPSAEQMDAWNAQARLVAETVAPGVVQIETFRKRSAEEIAEIHRMFGLSDSNGFTDSNGSADAGSNALTPPLDEAHRALRDPANLRQRSGYGSGFIVSAEQGYIVTNNHVIDEADEILVYLPDGRRFPAELLGADLKTDLAVLRIDAERLHALPLADGDDIEVGDDVMAVGNPFGLDGTFSRGIISAKGRSSVEIAGTEYQGFLQTDAVINPGNSGGPLVNMRGEVVAINTAIATQTGRYDGVGFAIPARRVAQMLPVLVRGEAVVRGYLGVSIVSAEYFEDLARSLGWEEYHGVIVREVMPGTPAAEFGLRANDIILKIDDTKMRATADLINLIGETQPGDRVQLTVWRDRGEIAIPVVVGKQPPNFTTRGYRPPAE